MKTVNMILLDPCSYTRFGLLSSAMEIQKHLNKFMNVCIIDLHDESQLSQIEVNSSTIIFCSDSLFSEAGVKWLELLDSTVREKLNQPHRLLCLLKDTSAAVVDFVARVFGIDYQIIRSTDNLPAIHWKIIHSLCEEKYEHSGYIGPKLSHIEFDIIKRLLIPELPKEIAESHEMKEKKVSFVKQRALRKLQVSSLNHIHYLNSVINKCTAVNNHATKVVSAVGNDSNLLIVFYVQIMPDDFVMQLHRF